MAPLTALTHSLCSAMPSKTGGFGAFWGILSLFCPKYLRRRESTRLRKKDVAWGHKDVAIIVTIKHTHCLYTYTFKIMEDFKNERKPIHA